MNFGKMMKQAQQMQTKMAKIQEELKGETLESSAGGGMVKVVITGDLQIKSITIDPAAVDPDEVDLLQDMVTAAVNEAVRAAQELSATKLSAVTGGVDIPGLM